MKVSSTVQTLSTLILAPPTPRNPDPPETKVLVHSCVHLCLEGGAWGRDEHF